MFPPVLDVAGMAEVEQGLFFFNAIKINNEDAAKSHE
jgi:hypothetical protein